MRRIGAIIPHTRLYGGVRRYIELGKALGRMGHTYTLFTPEGIGPDWMRFEGDIRPLAVMSGMRFDALVTSEECFLPELTGGDAAVRIFYVINKNKALREIARYREIVFCANSTTTFTRVKKTLGIEPAKVFGGIDAARCADRPVALDPGGPVTIMTYGRLSRAIKGTSLVVKACERLYGKGRNIRLLLFDSPVDERAAEMVRRFTCRLPFEFITHYPVERNHEMYGRAHIFAVAERKGGWSNTCAEAMSAGCAVVATKTGTEDFLENRRTGLVARRTSGSIARAIDTLLRDEGLRIRLAEDGLKEIRRWSWDRTADALLDVIEGRPASRGTNGGDPE